MDSIESLPPKDCDFVVLDFETECTVNDLVKLRQKKYYHILPIFYLGEPPNHHQQILDGPFDEKANDRVQKIQERMALLEEEQGTVDFDLEIILARYLFVRKDFILKAHLDYHVPSAVSYPLLELFSTNDLKEGYLFLLRSMEKHGYIAVERLVDEIQLCPHCASGLLNFKNCCPKCMSVDITSESFIHCFTCGNIGPISEFQRDQTLVCQRCHTQLRHIGIDYDKPMEDKICQECKHWFMDPLVQAICLVCEKLSDPDELKSIRIFEYHLTKRGAHLARNLDQELSISVNQFMDAIDFNMFQMIMKWQMLLAKRHNSVTFTLCALRLDNYENLVENVGRLRAEKIISRVFEQIKKLVRDTDLVSWQENTLYFLFPMTPKEDIDVINERLGKFAKQQSDQEKEIQFSIACLSVQEILDNKMDASLILTELNSRLSDD